MGYLDVNQSLSECFLSCAINKQGTVLETSCSLSRKLNIQDWYWFCRLLSYQLKLVLLYHAGFQKAICSNKSYSNRQIFPVISQQNLFSDGKHQIIKTFLSNILISAAQWQKFFHTDKRGSVFGVSQAPWQLAERDVPDAWIFGVSSGSPACLGDLCAHVPAASRALPPCTRTGPRTTQAAGKGTARVPLSNLSHHVRRILLPSYPSTT